MEPITNKNKLDINRVIFEKIAALVCRADFLEASAAFAAKNAIIFEDSEENKLEYTGVFESYVQILEQVIESSVRETHSQAQIDAFYGDFVMNFKKYQVINESAV